MHNKILAEIENINKYRRYLPHWRAEGVTYFVTWRLQKSSEKLINEERSKVAQAIEHFNNQRYALAGYVVMDDHVHVICKSAQLQTSGNHRTFVAIIFCSTTATNFRALWCGLGAGVL